MSRVNDHGWTELGDIRSIGGLDLHSRGPSVSIARSLDRRSCTCAAEQCHRVATQEDLLCDECRETCEQGS